MQAVAELRSLMEENDLIENAKDFQEIQENVSNVESSLVFILIYDIENEQKFNHALTEYFRSGIDKVKYKLGVVLDDRYKNQVLDLVQRDLPEFDLEDLLKTAIKQHTFVNLYDALVSAIFLYEEDSTMKIAVAVIMQKDDTKGFSKLKHLNLFQDKGVTLVILHKIGELTEDFEEYIKEESIICIPIEDFNELEKVFDSLKGVLKNLTRSRTVMQNSFMSYD